MKRNGSIIEVKEEHLERYQELHRAVWPKVLSKIKECHFTNYSIFLRKLPDGKHYLFSYFEYTGNDFAADCANMADDSVTQDWWALCKPCHEPLADRDEGEWWAEMEEVFHTN